MSTNQTQTFKYITCSKAAEAGDLEELKKMHLSGRTWDNSTSSFAAFNGQLECLKYAHENGCPWDFYTPALAAQNGHLDCLNGIIVQQKMQLHMVIWIACNMLMKMGVIGMNGLLHMQLIMDT